MRRFISFFMLVVAAATGCGGDSGSEPKVSLAGTYALSTVDGQILPIVVEDPDLKLELLSGSLSIDGTGRFTESVRLRLTFPGQPPEVVPVSCAGTYTRSGNTLTLTQPETDECIADTSTAVWDGRGTITVNHDDTIVVYKR